MTFRTILRRALDENEGSTSSDTVEKCIQGLELQRENDSHKQKATADVFEAIVGALSVEAGFDAVLSWIRPAFTRIISEVPAVLCRQCVHLFELDILV